MCKLFPGTQKSLLNEILNLIERRMREDDRMNKPLEPAVEGCERIPVARLSRFDKDRWFLG